MNNLAIVENLYEEECGFGAFPPKVTLKGFDTIIALAQAVYCV